MKKRILCFLLALLMLVSMAPAAAPRAAAVSRSASDNAIAVLKKLEGFHAKAYLDNGRWTIGYGTAAKEGDIITEATADKALRAELEIIDKAVSKFSLTVRRDFTQNEHDALVLFSYNCGTAWMTANGKFRQAIADKKTGNEFLQSICLWANVNGEPNRGLLNRRLAEANMFLNGIYNHEPPKHYTYVLLDPNGGSVGEYRALGYNTNLMAPVSQIPTLEGSRFMGWYTAKEGGSYVTALSSSVSGLVLYAHWQAEGAGVVNGNVVGTPASYTLSASYARSLKVYETPSTSAAVIKTLIQNAQMSVVAEYVDSSNIKWVKLRNGGWVTLGDVEKPAAGVNHVTVKVTATSVNIREKAGAYAFHKIVKRANYGELLNITETTTEGAQKWGRCDDGWVCLMYTDYDQVVMESDVQNGVAIATGVVSCNTTLKIRNGAGTFYAQVGSLSNGTKVALYEIKTVSGREWGRISSGWIALEYVKLDKDVAPDQKEDEDTSESGEKVIATGVVTHTYVNYRSGAGTSYAYKGQLPNGAKISLYEIKNVKGKDWGRFQDGWVCLDYVSVEKVKEEEEKEPTKYWDAVANAQLAVYDENGKKTNQVIRQGQSIRVFALGTRENENQTIAKINGGYVLAKYLTITVASEAGELAEDAQVYSRPGGAVTVKTLEKGTKVTVTKMQVLDDMICVYIKEANGWIDAELLTSFSGEPEDKEDVPDKEPTEPTEPEKDPGKEEDKNDQESDQKPEQGTKPPAGAKSGTVVGADVVNVRSSAGVRYDNLVTTLKRGTMVNVYETISKDGAQWGRIDQGWISMKYVKLNTASSDGSGGQNSSGESYATGFVHSSVNLNVRSGPGTYHKLVTTLAPGTEVRIYEQELSKGMIWGRIDQGWVCLSYVTMLSTGGSTGSEGSTEGSVMGTIARCYYAVNVRSAPGTGNALVGKILVGTRVEIYEQRKQGGTTWGRVNQGWISMDYVLLDSELPPPGEFEDGDVGNVPTEPAMPLPTVPKDAIYLGSVIGTKELNVRASASTKAAKTGTLKRGDSIVIYETAVTDYMAWGRCDEGWVSLVYINLVSCAEGAIDARVVQSLNAAIRDGAGYHYNKIASYPKATIVDIYETNGDWLRTDIGWVNVDDLLA